MSKQGVVVIDPVKELVLGLAALMATLFWNYFDSSPEAIAALYSALAVLVAAAIHLAYRMGHEQITEQERNDLWEKRKKAMETVKKRLEREKSNLDTLHKNPTDGAGNQYTEKMPFELIVRDIQPLIMYKGYGKLIRKITAECHEILMKPSGSRSVSRLMPLLKSLDAKVASRLQEERTWS